jgi:hypothetical protein
MERKNKPKNVFVIKFGILGIASGSNEILTVTKKNVILIRKQKK